jgi:hypothetical protein
MAGLIIGRLRAELGLGTAQFDKGLSKSQRRIKGFQKAFLGAFAGLASAAALKQLASGIQNSIDKLDELAKTADSIGVTTDALQELRVAADLSGVSQEELTNGMKRFARTASDANNGLATAMRGFDQLNISVTDTSGKLKPVDVLLAEVADSFAGMENATQKAALAQELFGRAGVKMVNLLNEGSAGIQRMRDEARALGLVIDEDLIRRSVEAKDELALMSKVLDTQLTVALANLAPFLINIATLLFDIAAAARDAWAGLKTLSGVQSLTPTEGLQRDLKQAQNELDRFDEKFNAVFGPDSGREIDPARKSKLDAERDRLVSERNAAQSALNAASAGGIDPQLPDPVTPASAPRGSSGGGGGRSRAPADRLNELEREIEAIKRATEETNRLTAAYSVLDPTIEDFGFSVAAAKAEVDLLNAAEQAGVEVTPELTQKIKELAAAYAQAEAEANKLADAQDEATEGNDEFARTSKDALGGFIDDLKTGQTFMDALINLTDKLADKLFDLALQSLEGGLFGGGEGGQGGGALGGLLGGLFGGGSGKSGGSSGGGLGDVFGGLLGSIFGLGFNNGGSFMVNGRPGIDNNLVAFRASAGERVDITPKGDASNPEQPLVINQTNQFLDANGAVEAAGTVARRTARGVRLTQRYT